MRALGAAIAGCRFAQLQARSQARIGRAGSARPAGSGAGRRPVPRPSMAARGSGHRLQADGPEVARDAIVHLPGGPRLVALTRCRTIRVAPEGRSPVRSW
ncbi:MAG: hypothetical protein WKF75_11910 [Singulisphaera sp.]